MNWRSIRARNCEVVMTEEMRYSVAMELLSLDEVCRHCRIESEVVVDWVELGFVVPQGRGVSTWRFAAASLPRLLQAARLLRELDLSPLAAAMMHELLDERRALERRVRVLERLTGEAP
jgi:chaperone modulatory protein CbpM